MPNYTFQIYDEFLPHKVRRGTGHTPHDALFDMLRKHPDASANAIYKIVSHDDPKGVPNGHYYRLNVEVISRGQVLKNEVLKNSKQNT